MRGGHTGLSKNHKFWFMILRNGGEEQVQKCWSVECRSGVRRAENSKPEFMACVGVLRVAQNSVVGARRPRSFFGVYFFF